MPTLLQTELLAGLPREDANELLALGTPLTLASGQVLFPLGAEAQALFLVARGRIALTLPMWLRGREQDVLVQEKGAGETVGWSALVAPHHFTLKATALVESELLSFPRTGLAAHLAAKPAVGHVVTTNLAAIVARRLHVAQAMWLREMQRVVELSCE
ncbi:MAG: cyclic nucleotide-binding domain-containing protein [Acidobacteria bacterium]|nr:cyclic nucleotide-binding domain-containing protein [Acidobacteriota bacterium]